MTPDQFDAAAAETRMQTPATNAARMVLVDGMKPGHVAERFGLSREWARAAAKRVERAHLRRSGVPEGWELVEVAMPPQQAAEVRERSMALLEARLRSG